jgi:glycosyltransferase involved in cell wall biosynthesis
MDGATEGKIMNLLYIVPKLNYGGGVGNVISELNALHAINKRVSATVVSLEKTYSPDFYRRIKAVGGSLRVAPGPDALRALIDRADLVVVVYWNHPLLTAFLTWYYTSFIKVPIIISVQVNGQTPPQIMPEWVVALADGIIKLHYTTFLRDAQKPFVDLLPFMSLPLHPPAPPVHAMPFTVFYAGSLNRFKRYSGLIDLNDRIANLNVRVEYWGAGEDQDFIQQLEKSLKGAYCGFSSNIFQDFQQKHLLVNPQSTLSYGANEKIMFECAWMGIPSLVLQSSFISQVIQDGVNGIVVPDEEGYLECIEHYSRDASAFNSLAAKTYDWAHSVYSLTDMAKRLSDFYAHFISMRNLSAKHGALPSTPTEAVLAGIGYTYSEITVDLLNMESVEKLDYILHCEGGLMHYLEFHSDDEVLNQFTYLVWTVYQQKLASTTLIL